MRIIVVLILLVLSVNLKGQNVTNRINDIRDMYQKTQKEKSHYQKQVKDITWDSFEYDEDEDRNLKKAITYYYKANKIKIAVICTNIISDYSSYVKETECYFENDTIYFIYSVERHSERTSLNSEQSSETINVKEERVYLNDLGKCIRYLKKEVDGSIENIDSLCKKEQNVEQDCSNSIDIIREINSLVNHSPTKND